MLSIGDPYFIILTFQATIFKMRIYGKLGFLYKSHKGCFEMKAHVMLLILMSLMVFSARTFCQNSDSEVKLIPKVIKLESGGKDYLRVLDGPPESSTMRSGLVTLAPSKSVGKHSTEKFEELIIVIEGKGVMEVMGGPTLLFTKGEVLYCPPNTEHNVTNNGGDNLIYLYVVAEAKK